MATSICDSSSCSIWDSSQSEAPSLSAAADFFDDAEAFFLLVPGFVGDLRVRAIVQGGGVKGKVTVGCTRERRSERQVWNWLGAGSNGRGNSMQCAVLTSVDAADLWHEAYLGQGLPVASLHHVEQSTFKNRFMSLVKIKK